MSIEARETVKPEETVAAIAAIAIYYLRITSALIREQASVRGVVLPRANRYSATARPLMRNLAP